MVPLQIELEGPFGFVDAEFLLVAANEDASAIMGALEDELVWEGIEIDLIDGIVHTLSHQWDEVFFADFAGHPFPDRIFVGEPPLFLGGGIDLRVVHLLGIGSRLFPIDLAVFSDIDLGCPFPISFAVIAFHLVKVFVGHPFAVPQKEPSIDEGVLYPSFQQDLEFVDFHGVGI